MNVFISYSHKDSEFVLNLVSGLEQDGHNVFYDKKLAIGINLIDQLGKKLANADAVIFIISQNSNNSEFVSNEILSISSLSSKGKAPLIIPIVIGDHTFIPYDIARYNFIYVSDSNDQTYANDIQVAIDKVRLTLSAHDENQKKAKQEKEKIEAKVKNGLSQYIDDVFVTLQKNEKRNKWFAYGLYSLSAIALIGIPLIIYFTAHIDILSTENEKLIAYGVIYLFFTIILVSFSKLFFTLAKAFMVESIRCSDRIHAISFGKFFIEAYGDEATIEQILQAFSAWNYDNGGSSFRTQSGEDFDPKFLEVVSKLKG